MGLDEVDVNDVEAAFERIRAQAAAEDIRITQHAQQEMVEEDITLDEIMEAIATGRILENYPGHRRGACCLLNGFARSGRPIHIVCTTARPVLIIVTVYEPRPPKWMTPTQRRQ
ncbi:MAG: DUF4258 domain-containing protein [Syntrophales bacterium]|nr:DUF4258 domain-containing protein [Syntrophales bacterium]